MRSQASIALVLATLTGCAEARAFLGPASADYDHEAFGSRSLIEALEKSLGDAHRGATARLGKLEDALRPTFASLPKNERGAVDAPAARYALHRLFIQRHGWQINGLTAAGETWDAGSPTAAFGNRVPAHVRRLFEGRLGQGLDLRELALMAATLEHLVHTEAVKRLEVAYGALGFDEGRLNQDEATKVVDTYMAAYILGTNTSDLSPEDVLSETAGITDKYPSWPETQSFLRTVQAEVAGNAESLSFFHVASIVEEVGERYGRWQQSECQALKGQLLGMEDVKGSGRVRLSDFYAGALDSNWQFGESPVYLRHLGALDESNPKVPKLIIPNYINGPSNCVASAGYYSVCCIDECEALMGHLESAIAAPSAAPADILRLVAALPSSSAPANRTLPVQLVQRLEEVAAHHGGQVPLHGRLFAQWLHHAYPRECPYPHLAGTTNPLRPEAWEAATGLQVGVSEEEVLQHTSAVAEAPNGTDAGRCSAMWTMQEELVAVDRHGAKGSLGGLVRAPVLLVAAASVAFGLARTVQRGLAVLGGEEVLPRSSKHI